MHCKARFIGFAHSHLTQDLFAPVIVLANPRLGGGPPRMLIRSIWPWLILGLLAVGGGIFFSAAHMEENDAFCASCHTQPESTYFNRSQAAQAVDVASFHHGQSVRCIDCHSGSGLVGRMGGMLVGAGDLLAFVTHTAQQPAPLTVPIRDENCLKCHADTPRTRQF